MSSARDKVGDGKLAGIRFSRGSKECGLKDGHHCIQIDRWNSNGGKPSVFPSSANGVWIFWTHAGYSTAAAGQPGWGKGW